METTVKHHNARDVGKVEFLIELSLLTVGVNSISVMYDRFLRLCNFIGLRFFLFFFFLLDIKVQK